MVEMQIFDGIMALDVAKVKRYLKYARKEKVNSSGVFYSAVFWQLEHSDSYETIFQIVKILHKHSLFDLNQLEVRKYPLIYYYLKAGHLHIAHHLFLLGADVNICFYEDAKYLTNPLTLFLRDEEKFPMQIQWLIYHGAKLDLKPPVVPTYI